jgi:ribonuclease E
MHAQPHGPETTGEPEGEEFVEAEGESPAGDAAFAGEQQGEAQFGEGEDRADPQGERRRRRRGRRGGRRNRQEREHNGFAGHEGEQEPQAPQHEFAADENAWPAQSETEPAQAAGDFDSRETDSEPPVAPSVAASEPTHAEASPQPASAFSAEPEPPAPRHRSTVREAAPVGSDADTSAAAAALPAGPAPEPVITEYDEGESASRPRRKGWWSRRSAGE